MFRSYVTIGWRNILKYKTFSFINVFGLAIAMSVCMLIMLMLADHKRYDQFHEKKERIYRILSDRPGSKAPSATTPSPLASALKTDYPVVEDATQLRRGVGGDLLYNGTTAEARGYFADASFFNVFSYDVTGGNVRRMLATPNTIVISAALAQQLFNGAEAVGKVVDLNNRGLSMLGDGEPGIAVPWGSYTITGVVKDNGHRSHLKFDVLLSAASLPALYAAGKIGDNSNDWFNDFSVYTYALTTDGKSEAELTAALQDIVTRRYAGREDMKGFALAQQKLTAITPGILVSNAPGYTLPLIAYYFLSLLALIIMVSACLNYTNLATARALTRMKEIGVRKVTGAHRKNLILQFLSESTLTSLMALGMALILLVIIKPAFLGLWVNRYLDFSLQVNGSVYLMFIGFSLIIGLISGLYPALHLSKYQPARALKSLDTLRPGKLSVRKVLSVSQFVVSLFFITTVVLIYNQFRHYLDFEYGFNAKNVVNISLQGNDHRRVIHEFLTVSGVASVSASDIIPATNVQNGISLRVAGSDVEYTKFGVLLTDDNFLGNLGLSLVAGENMKVSGDSTSRFVLVNEAAVHALGYAHAPDIVGEMLQSKGGTEELTVVGVTKDFQHTALVNEDGVSPMILRYQPESFGYVSVRMASDNAASTLSRLENRWKAIDPVNAFRYDFYEDRLDAMYRGFFDVVAILGFIAFLAVVIACLGLLGMAMYITERRRKEVGIRKILGAADSSIVVLLSRSFLKVLGIAICVGGPLSYFVNNLWLQSLPNRVNFGWGTVLVGVITLLVLGLVTIGTQTLRASRSNPVQTLKMDG
jgi:putative ABC transport system permease protein